MKKILLSIVCIAFIGILTACGGAEEEVTEENTPTPAEEQATDEQGTEEQTDQETAPNTQADGEQATEDQGQTADAGAADALYQQSCAQCHGADLISGGAPDLNAIGSKYSHDQILEIIQNGQGNMPGGLLSGEDAEAVASWLTEKK